MNTCPTTPWFKTLFPIGLLLIAVPQLLAASGTWSSSAANPGLWSDSGNWNSGTIADGTGFTATFNRNISSAQTIRLDTAQILGNISITNANAAPGSWLLDNNGNAANILTLDVTSGAPTITVGANYSHTSTNAATISAVIAGNDGLTKAGAGRLILSGNNTYSGTTTVSGGWLVAAHSNALGSGGVTVTSSASNNSTTIVQALGFQGGITIANAITTSGGNDSYLNNLSGDNVLTGGITASTNTRLVAAAGSSLTIRTGNISNNRGTSGYFTSGGDGLVTIESDLTGDSGFSRSNFGAGILFLKGEKTYTGWTNPNGGILRIDHIANGGVASSIGMSSNSADNLRFSEGSSPQASTLQYIGATTSTDRSFSIGGTHNTAAAVAIWDITEATTTLTVAGGASSYGSGGTGTALGSFEKKGAGSLVLAGTNRYSGSTTVSAGTLQFGKQVSLYNNTTGSWTAANIRVANGATLAFNVGGTDEFTTGNVTTLLTNLAASTSATNGMNAGSSLGFDTTNASGAFTISNVIANTTGAAGGSRGLVKLGTGTLELTGANTYTGSTLVTGGTLVISGTGSIANSAATVRSGATLNVNGTAGIVAVNANGALTGTGTLGATTIAGHHSPGNSPGVQNFASDLTYTNGSSVAWELIDNTDAGRGINFDGIDVVDDLTITGTSTINLVFNLGTSDVLWADSFWDTDRSWLFYDVGGLVSGAFALGNISVDSLGNSLSADRGTFAITYQGSDVYLTYSAIPEPSTTLLLTVGLMATLLLRRRARN